MRRYRDLGGDNYLPSLNWMAREKPEGKALSFWYGMAYYDGYIEFRTGTAVAICYPIPINYLVALYKKFIDSRTYRKLRIPGIVCQTRKDEISRLKCSYCGHEYGINAIAIIQGEGKNKKIACANCVIEALDSCETPYTKKVSLAI